MKFIYIVFGLLTSLSIISCSDSSDSGSGPSITVTIDSVDVVFTGCGAFNNGFEHQFSCNHVSGGEAKRLTLTKAFDINGGAVGIKLVDVPDSAFLDSAYGIEYSCDSAATLSACLDANVPTYDAGTTTISLSNVVVPLVLNRTATEAPFIEVIGPASHTVSLSVVASTIPDFQ